MLAAWLGSVGIGLVWGWLVAGLEGYARQPWRTILVILLATLALGASVFWFTTQPGVLFFLGAALVAWLVRVEWRRELRERID